jgi:hypothetical protein
MHQVLGMMQDAQNLPRNSLATPGQFYGLPSVAINCEAK